MIKKGDTVLVEVSEEIKEDIPVIARVLDVDDGLAEIELMDTIKKWGDASYRWLEIMYPGMWDKSDRDELRGLEFDGVIIDEVVKVENNWKEEGRCPICGELGDFIQLAMTCSKHGVY